jgi:hypothetical protein
MDALPQSIAQFPWMTPTHTLPALSPPIWSRLIVPFPPTVVCLSSACRLCRELLLPRETGIGLSRDSSGKIIHGREHFPLGRLRLLRHPATDRRFQVVIALAAPPGISERHEQVFRLRRRVVNPLPVRPSKTSERVGKAVRTKQLFAGQLVRVTRMGQFLAMDDLADVVKGGTLPHRPSVVGERRPHRIEPCRQQTGDIVHEREMRDQPRGAPS